MVEFQFIQTPRKNFLAADTISRVNKLPATLCSVYWMRTMKMCYLGTKSRMSIAGLSKIRVMETTLIILPNPIAKKSLTRNTFVGHHIPQSQSSLEADNQQTSPIYLLFSICPQIHQLNMSGHCSS